MADNVNIHQGHRQRLKERFLREGLEHFNEINTLELLLFYCVQRKDTNPLAHRLLDKFGRLCDVFHAPAEELMKVEGVTEHVATYLTLLSQFCRYYQINKVADTAILDTIEKCARYLMAYFHELRDEVVYLLCLDAKSKLLCCRMISQGTVNSTSISTRRIVEIALSCNATTVILAHNHPSGIALPSAEDINTTWELKKLLQSMGIILADHLIVAEGDYVSLFTSRRYGFLRE